MEHEAITTPRRRDEVLSFIARWMVRNHGSIPTYDEIGQGLGFNKSRAQQLVQQLIDRKIIERTPGAQRHLRICDPETLRSIAVQTLNDLGMTTALPMGELQQPCSNVQLPRIIEIRHLGDDSRGPK